MLRDELLAASLSKQVTIDDDSRQMRFLLDTQQTAAQTAVNEVSNLKARLEEESRAAILVRNELNTFLTGAHQKALTELAEALETVRVVEQEIEGLRSQLRSATVELISFRDSLDTSNILIEELQRDLMEMQDKEKMVKTIAEEMRSENMSYKINMQNVNEKLIVLNNEVTVARVSLSENEEERESQRKRLVELESALINNGGRLGEYEKAEAELTRDLER